MVRTTIRSSNRSFTLQSSELRSDYHETAPSGVVHLQFHTIFYSQTRAAEGASEEGDSAQTPSFRLLSLFVNDVTLDLGSLPTRDEMAGHVRRHLSNMPYEPLLDWVDHIAGELWYLILPRDGLPALGSNDSLVVVSTTTVTYHLDMVQRMALWEAVVDSDLELSGADDMTDALEETLVELALEESEELAASDSDLFDYEPQTVPASKASVDALERRKVDEEEEINGQKVCVVCQDEVGRGDYLAKMPCSHEFHEDCILAWLERAHSCPLCRFECFCNS